MKDLATVTLATVIVVGALCIVPLLIWFAWNTLAPLFGGPQITALQSVAVGVAASVVRWVIAARVKS